MKRFWSLIDDWNHFDCSGSDVRPAVWSDRPCLYLDDCTALLHEDLHLESFRIQAEIACPGPNGFVGLIFGARDSMNCELVYVSPGNDRRSGEIQYDPRMNGSSTWQIYHGPVYQAPAPFTPGEWTKLTLDVQPNGVAITVGENQRPQLVVSGLQLGRSTGRIGVWSHMPGYIRNLSVEETEPFPIHRKEPDLQKLADEGFVTEWLVSEPYTKQVPPSFDPQWISASVEENGTLNLNRLYASTEGTSIQAKYTLHMQEVRETTLTFGYSDHLRLWVNDAEVYQGEWIWNPPHSDGRIRSQFASVPIRLQAGPNMIRAEVTNLETIFGWGLSVNTGLSVR